MKFDLYPDQRADVDALRPLVQAHRSVLYQLPTGGGKTVCAGYIAQRLRQRGRRILILVHRRELVRQFLGTLRNAGLAEQVGVICPGFESTPWAPVQLAMIMSYRRREPDFRPDFIFIDEAHHARAASWEVVLERYPSAYILGMTATPCRLDGKGLGTHFRHLYCGWDIPRLIAEKRLSPVRVMRVQVGFRRTGLRKTGGDYNRKDMDERADERVVGNAVAAYRKYTPGRRALMFGVSKRHARATAERFHAEGVSAAYVGDDTPMAERDSIFARFGDGEIDVVCNVALVDEGFDVPACDVVMDVAHTASVVRYLQRVGRALRYRPGKEAVLLDLVGNSYYHGLPDAERSWSLDEKSSSNGEQRTGNPKQVRHCRKCQTVFKPTQAFCPHCGAEHDGKPVSEVDVELIEAAPAPAPAPKLPKMTLGDRRRLLRHCHYLTGRGQERKAWALLRDAAAKANYKPAWAHIMADNIGIDPKARRTDP